LWSLAARADGLARDADAREPAADARREIHLALQKALYDYERQQYNTVVSACMSIVNILYKLEDGAAATLREGLGIVLRLLAPVAPHVTHVLWRELGFGDDILAAGWPEVDEAALVSATTTYVIQVNGKMRGRIEAPTDAGRDAVEQLALANDNVQRFVDGLTVRKIIVVPGKLVNVVAS
jgi:leucyl-tRNA synthetase